MMDKELTALIKLLDDPNEQVFEIVQNQLLQRKENLREELEKAKATFDSPLFCRRADTLIQTFCFRSLKKNLRQWSQEAQPELLKGAYLVASYQYPELRFEELEQSIEYLVRTCASELNPTDTPLQKIRTINHVLFQIHRFAQNTKNYFSPQNFYINQVLDSKKGSAISLSIIYIVVCQRLHLPVYGISLPRNFIVAYQDPTSQTILFYMNPANLGIALGRKEIDLYLQQLNVKNEEWYYLPCSSKTIVERLFLSLVDVYQRLGKKDKIMEINTLHKILKGKQKA